MNTILKVGASKVDITPSETLLPIPFFFMFEMDEPLDHIHLRVLNVENENERIIFVTFDTTFVPNPQETARYISELTGLDSTHIFLAATHTHCVPIVGTIESNNNSDDKIVLWYTEIKTALKQAIKEAKNNTRIAKMGFHTGKSYINVNRDEIDENGHAVIGVNFEKESDKTLNVLKFEDNDGKAIAYLVNYAVHATIMNGCLIGKKIRITGDLPGVTSNIIENNYEGAVCLWTSGAAGDQNPRFSTQFPEKNVTDFSTIKNLGETGRYVLEYLANEHARDILKTISQITCDQTNVIITAQKRIVKCEGRTPESAKQFATLQGITLPPPADVEYTLRLMTIGDLAIQGISAEIVTSIGEAVRSVSPFKNTILITQTDTYGGYVPNDWEYEHNAFEAEGATVRQGVAQPAFEKTFHEMFQKI